MQLHINALLGQILSPTFHSLLHDAARASKPAPLISNEYTGSIEDVVKRRVKEGRYDDVVPLEKGHKQTDPDAGEEGGIAHGWG